MEVPANEILEYLIEHLHELQRDIKMILDIISMLSNHEMIDDTDDDENNEYQYDMYRAKSLLYSS